MKRSGREEESEAKETGGPRPEVEIEYKEFKLSEFLEIRRKQESPEGEAVDSQRTVVGEKPPRTREVSPGIEEGKKRAATIIAFIFAGIAVIGGLFFLLRFFMK